MHTLLAVAQQGWDTVLDALWPLLSSCPCFPAYGLLGRDQNDQLNEYLVPVANGDSRRGSE